MNTQNLKLSVRVYGIVTESNHALLSYENWYERYFFKFPGGGLEPGESPLETLRREFHEELSTEIQQAVIIHIPQKFILSIFYPETQVLPIHYHVLVKKQLVFPYWQKEVPLPKLKHSQYAFFWVPFHDVEKLLTFDSDRESWQVFLKKNPWP